MSEVTNGIAPSDEIRLDPSELVYFRRVSEGLTRANQLEQEAIQHERQVAALRQQATALIGAHESWSAYLIEKYQLDPQSDRISPETGVIERAGGQVRTG